MSAAALAGVWFYNQGRPSTPEKTAPAARQVAPKDAEHTAKPPPAPGTIREAVVKLLQAENGGLFPKGSALRGVSLKEEVATLDFNAAFRGLEDKGASAESEAQKALMHAVAPFPNVQKMRVTIEGRGFESQSTDWGIPFDVRPSNARR